MAVFVEPPRLVFDRQKLHLATEPAGGLEEGEEQVGYVVEDVTAVPGGGEDDARDRVGDAAGRGLAGRRQGMDANCRNPADDDAVSLAGVRLDRKRLVLAGGRDDQHSGGVLADDSDIAVDVADVRSVRRKVA